MGDGSMNTRRVLAALGVILVSLFFGGPRVACADQGWLHPGETFCSTWQAGQLKPGGAAGGGIAEVTIVAVDGDKVIGVVQSFADLRQMGFANPVPQVGIGGFAGTLEQYSDYWISPAKLAAIPNDPPHGSTVAHVSYKTPGGNVDCIQWTEQTPTSYENHVFDAQTGFCYHFATQGASGAAADGDFLGMRDLNLPWANEAPPDWVKTVKVLHYRGNVQYQNAFVNIPTAVALDMTISDRGNGWLMFTDNTQVQVGNSPPIPSQSVFASGNAQIGGVWIGPATLANLQQGQVIDQDAITQMKTVVSSVDGNSVTISQSSPCGQRDYQYDKQTGIMTGWGFTDVQLKQRTVLQLQSKE
jgi:hypothetical protein